MSDKPIILIGYSGHAFVVADAAIKSNMNLKYYTEMEKKKLNPFHLEYLGNESSTEFEGWKLDCDFILGIGNNNLRHSIGEKIKLYHKQSLNVIHPSAEISSIVKIGIGNFIGKNVSINPLSNIGDYCILNTGCIIEHDCVIANGVHIAPGAVLTGNVKVGTNSFIGANSVIKQGIEIGNNVTIGAGAVVLNNVEDNIVIIGNPGKKFSK